MLSSKTAGFRATLATLTLALLGALRLAGGQRFRVGGLELPHLGLDWMFLGVVFAVLISPGRRGSRCLPSTRRALWLAALLAMMAIPLGRWRATLLKADARLIASAETPGSNASSPSQLKWLELSDARRRIPYRRITGRSHGTPLVAKGFFFAPDEGDYRFEWEAGGRAAVHVDGQRLTEPSARGQGSIRLEPGPHALEVRYAREGLHAFLKLDWDRSAIFEPLPFEYFVCERQVCDGSVVRRQEALALFSLLLGAVWWGGLGLTAVVVGTNKKLVIDVAAKRAMDAIRHHPSLVPSAWIFAGAAALFFLWQGAHRPEDPNDPYYRTSSSEFMMQTVSVVDLRDQPFRSLWYLHIQPPMLDLIRTVAVHLPPASDETLLERVDRRLYVLWGLLYAGLIALTFSWLSQLANKGFALGGAALLAAHPAAIHYASLLDGTLLSTVGITWFFYELWSLSARDQTGVGRLVSATLFLFFTRSVFQWPFLVVATLALAIQKRPLKQIAVYVSVTALVMGLFLMKQYRLFGVTYTSTFAGYNGCRSIGADLGWRSTRVIPVPDLPPASAARVLSREEKVNGKYNFNQLRYLEVSFILMDRYLRTLREQPWRETLSAYRQNLATYLTPSSLYRIDPSADEVSPIVEPIPWRSVYDFLSSGLAWVASISIAALWWLTAASRAGRVLAGVGLALPAAYIALVSVLFESGENMRFRFFVEPLALILVVSTLHSFVEARRRRHSDEA